MNSFLLTSLLLLSSIRGLADEPVLQINEYPVEWQGVPRDPYVAPNQSVWFCGQAGNYLARFDPASKSFKRFDIPDGTHPHNLIVDQQGMVWFAGNRAAYIGILDPKDGSVKKITMPSGVTDPHTLVFDQQGDIWFTAQHSNVVGHLNTTNHQLKIFPVPTPKARPYGIKMAPDNRPWIALLGTNKLGTVDQGADKVREVVLPREGARPRRLEITDDGSIWTVDYAEGHLVRYQPKNDTFSAWLMPGGKDSKPYGTALDSNARLWIAETDTYPNRIIGFDTKTERFIGSEQVKADGTVRHMHFDPKQQQFWFGIDSGALASAKPTDEATAPKVKSSAP